MHSGAHARHGRSEEILLYTDNDSGSNDIAIMMQNLICNEEHTADVDDYDEHGYDDANDKYSTWNLY